MKMVTQEKKKVSFPKELQCIFEDTSWLQVFNKVYKVVCETKKGKLCIFGISSAVEQAISAVKDIISAFIVNCDQPHLKNCRYNSDITLPENLSLPSNMQHSFAKIQGLPFTVKVMLLSWLKKAYNYQERSATESIAIADGLADLSVVVVDNELEQSIINLDSSVDANKTLDSSVIMLESPPNDIPVIILSGDETDIENVSSSTNVGGPKLNIDSNCRSKEEDNNWNYRTQENNNRNMNNEVNMKKRKFQCSEESEGELVQNFGCTLCTHTVSMNGGRDQQDPDAEKNIKAVAPSSSSQKISTKGEPTISDICTWLLCDPEAFMLRKKKRRKFIKKKKGKEHDTETSRTVTFIPLEKTNPNESNITVQLRKNVQKEKVFPQSQQQSSTSGPRPNQHFVVPRPVSLTVPPSNSLASSLSSCEQTLSSDLPASQSLVSISSENRVLRPVVIDGSNVAMTHGKAKNVFSCKGIEISIKYFLSQGHTNVVAFVPQMRRQRHFSTVDQDILERLAEKQQVVFTPSRRINGKCINSYDDRFIVKLAHANGGVIVSNDNFRDIMLENAEWKATIQNRLLMYCFVGDIFMIPDDPLGKDGPSLEDFLSFPASRTPTTSSGSK